MSKFSTSHSLRNDLISNLSKIVRLPIDDSNLGRAAVVVAIREVEDGRSSPCFLLTRRASNMRQHAGQFALPGGKVDEGESAIDAALRELEEELGLSVDTDQILGILDDYPTRSGFCITPVVVWLDPNLPIVPNPAEVAEVFTIPLEELHAESLVALQEGEKADNPVLSINLPTIGHEIYAPTAAIIYQFYEWAILGKDSRVAFYDEPQFAWR